MKILYTADTHFNQERTFKYSMRNMYFANVAEATSEMVKRWNEQVSPEDMVYHLGDFGDFDVAKQLNGHIILLYGNYEREQLAPTPEQKKYFLKIIEDKFTYNAQGVMVHEPENKCAIGEKEEVLFGRPKEEIFYLFGHIHEKQKVKRHGLNVGVDVHNFTPVSSYTVEFYKKAIETVYDDNCFENY